VSDARHVPVTQVAPLPAVLIVLLLQRGDPVGRQRLALVVLVETRVVVAEDRGLDRPVGGAERLQVVGLLEVLGDLQPAQRLDLPLRRARPDGVAAPHDVVELKAGS